ncbi:MAG TPA: dephospho-CoA kinase [Paludibacteraceae bacterium]|nr:dephospho-CoA kinase [Paludibacteraceae bacterium]HOL30005.1 dephospho-CoA kinase [Paludibacteraceae bacterium]HPD60092.1 dephospho-CoA kinase [Paludibacteraceae bacterium]HPQ13416.1 dephospho-CoA kinase [Paludibacteraceae bacterium]HRS23975.1 dephospho-CoA kinase [Paludibacteraceae bacterium]
MNRPLIVGITGGIGSGKSTLSNKLRAEGYQVYDCDKEAKKLQNEHPVIREKIRELFGEDIYTESGLDRKKVADIVFQNRDLLDQLNKIVHPFVREDFLKWVGQYITEKFLFMESAILFESGFIDMVDKVILMTASEDVRIRRVVKRDGIDPERVRARISKQLPDTEKIPFSDFIIHSDDGKPLYDKMKKILKDMENYVLD